MVPDRRNDARAEADRSFERLYEGLRDDVYRAALRELRNVEDAEDATQAAFVDAYRAILRGSRPRAPRAWLLAIAENVRRRRLRTALRRPREEPLDVETASSTGRAEEQAGPLLAALAELPPHQGEVFLLREISGLSYGEIAERVGSTVPAVQMLLFRARRSLRAELDPPEGARRGRALGLPLPGWPAQLVGRGDTLALAPRGLGAVGAAALALTGITAGGAGPRHDDPRRPEPVRASSVAAAMSGTAGASVGLPALGPAIPAPPAAAATKEAAAESTPIAPDPTPATPARPAPAPAGPPPPREAARPPLVSPPPAVVPPPPELVPTAPAVVPPPSELVPPGPVVLPAPPAAPPAPKPAELPDPLP